MQQININELKPHPRNNEFFDDMTGDAWDSMIQSVRSSGITNAITITDKNIIISGHQRVRACKVLNIESIDYKVIHYSDDDYKKETDVKDLIESNLRQRVVGNANPIKLGKCFQFLNDWYGFEHGAKSFQGNQHKKVSAKFLHTPDLANTPSTQKDLAQDYGISHQTMNNYIRLAKSIPELEDLVDTGIVTTHTALAIMKELSEDEQIKLISSMDTTKKITQKQVQQYIDKIKQLENDNPKVKELETQISELKTEKNILERKVKLNQEESDKYNKLKSDIEFLTKQKTDLGRQIDSATELAGLTVRLQKLLETELAPIKFKRCMEELDSSDVCVGNLTDIINRIDDWSDEMKKLLNNNNDYVVDVQ
jgi:DNA repair exonuclease SbcCD ATPase subunit